MSDLPLFFNCLLFLFFLDVVSQCRSSVNSDTSTTPMLLVSVSSVLPDSKTEIFTFPTLSHQSRKTVLCSVLWHRGVILGSRGSYIFRIKVAIHQIRHQNGFIKFGLLEMKTQKWGPVVMNHTLIGVGPLHHHKSSCCERSTNLITTNVKVKRVLSFFSVALLSLWKDVCKCFNTMALFLLWFLHSDGTWNTIPQEYWLKSTWGIVQWSQTKCCSRVTWRCSKTHVPTWKKWNDRRSWTQPNGPNAATGGNLSFWIFTGWL